MMEPLEFSGAEIEVIQIGLDQVRNGVVEIAHPVFVIEKLQQLWRFGNYAEERSPLYDLGSPRWTFGMTDDFTKAVQGD